MTRHDFAVAADLPLTRRETVRRKHQADQLITASRLNGVGFYNLFLGCGVIAGIAAWLPGTRR